MPLTARDRLGPYEIVAKLGEGGMGEVYRARDTQLNRDVAIKVLPELFSADHERVARFTREAQTLAALNHPNIAHGRELFYLADDGWMMAVALTTTATAFDSSVPKRLFKARMLTRGFEPQFEYDVTRDGQRFLIGNIVDGPEGSPPHPMVILNWAADLKR